MQGYIPRRLEQVIADSLANFPAVALLADLDVEAAWVAAPVAEPYPLRQGVTVAPLGWLLRQGLP